MLSYVLYNSNLLSIKDLLRIGAASKEFHSNINDHITYTYNNKVPITHKNIRINNDTTISHTDAKKIYKLSDDDMKQLAEHHDKYNPISHTIGRLYYLSDVISLAMYTHKRYTYTSLMKPKPVTIRVKRKEQIDKLIVKYSVPNDEVEEIPQVKTFMRNGNGGVRLMEKVIRTYANLMPFIPNLPKPVTDYLDICENQNVSDIITQVLHDIEKQQLDNQRSALLIDALSNVGLTLNPDSETCKRFIEGNTSLTLEQVVDIMKELHFYYTYTGYDKRVNNKLIKAYREARNHILDTYGIIGYDAVYNSLLEERVQRDTLVINCKQDLLRNYLRKKTTDKSIVPQNITSALS